MLHEKNFTIVDVETTGGNPFFNRVIEIGLLRVEKGEVVEEYQTFLNPGIPIPEFITKMTGISEEHVASAPTFEELADDVLAKFENAIFVAHNSQFDYGFLHEEFRRLGYGFNVDQLCTVKLSRTLFPEFKRHNLTELIARYKFECANRHRAFDDAKVLWDFLQHVHANVPEAQLRSAFKRLLKQPRAAAIPKLAEGELEYEPIAEHGTTTI
ncbi:MAG: 3'-5' exonuclease [bacterium]|nr:3'-5' exonuclease [bacterium]